MGTLDAEDRIGAQRADALRHLAEHYLGCESDARISTAERYQVVVHVDQALLGQAPTSTEGDGHSERDETGSVVPEPLRCETDDGIPLAVETVRRLGCDGSVVGIVEGADGEPLSIGRRTRAIPVWMKRALKSRDGGCRSARRTCCAGYRASVSSRTPPSPPTSSCGSAERVSSGEGCRPAVAGGTRAPRRSSWMMWCSNGAP